MIFLSLFVFILYAALFYLVNPRGIIPQLIYVLYAAISGLTALFSFILFTRSPKYVEQLNQIVGFSIARSNGASPQISAPSTVNNIAAIKPDLVYKFLTFEFNFEDTLSMVL